MFWIEMYQDKQGDPDGTMKTYEVYDDEDKIFNDAIYNKLVAALDDLEMTPMRSPELNWTAMQIWL